MPSEGRWIYWDSDVVIAYLSKTPQHYSTLDKILEDVGDSKGQQKIVTSIVAKIEVAYIGEENSKTRLTDKDLAAIDDFWMDSSVVSVVELNETIAGDDYGCSDEHSPVAPLCDIGPDVRMVDARRVVMERTGFR